MSNISSASKYTLEIFASLRRQVKRQLENGKGNELLEGRGQNTNDKR